MQNSIMVFTFFLFLICKFGPKNPFGTLMLRINLLADYLQRLKISGFSCSYSIWKGVIRKKFLKVFVFCLGKSLETLWENMEKLGKKC